MTGTGSLLERAPICAERLRPGLQLLIDAFDYAADLRTRTDEFALEVYELVVRGFLTIDLLWLTRKGYLGRTHPGAVIEMNDRVYLTLAGASTARTLLSRNSSVCPLPHPQQARAGLLPVWDQVLRELWWDELVVKRFRAPAPNQELILGAFQEEGWPCRIDDPLPIAKGIVPKRRLHDTITALNRHRSRPSVRFFGDGTGLGIRWAIETHGAKAC
jgi:hypothetical protein